MCNVAVYILQMFQYLYFVPFWFGHLYVFFLELIDVVIVVRIGTGLNHWRLWCLILLSLVGGSYICSYIGEVYFVWWIFVVKFPWWRCHFFFLGWDTISRICVFVHTLNGGTICWILSRSLVSIFDALEWWFFLVLLLWVLLCFVQILELSWLV